MRSSKGDTGSGNPPPESAPVRGHSDMFAAVLEALADAKAVDVVKIDLKGKSSIGDHMVIASGGSHRQVGAIAHRVLKRLKAEGHGRARVEGMPACDWVLIDAGDVIVHIFRPEVRQFYNLEKMWSTERPSELLAMGDEDALMGTTASPA